MASTMKRLVQAILGHVQVVTPITRTLIDLLTKMHHTVAIAIQY